MGLDESVVRAAMAELLDGSRYLRRVALCRWGVPPLLPPDVNVADGPESKLWDALVSFLSGAETMVLLPRGSGVAMAVLFPGTVLVAEFDKTHQLGVAAALLRKAADEILSVSGGPRGQ